MSVMSRDKLSEVRRTYLAVGAILAVVALTLLIQHSVVPVPFGPPAPPPCEGANCEPGPLEDEPDPLEKALEELTKNTDDNVGIYEVSGRSCQELNPEMATELAGVIQSSHREGVRLFFFSKNTSLAFPLYTGLREVHDSRWEVDLRAAMDIHMARLAFSEGDIDSTTAYVARLADSDVSPCLVADGEYLMGRIAEKGGDTQAAFAAYKRAVEANPILVPAHIALVAMALQQPELNEIALAGVFETVAVQKFSDARRYASDFVDLIHDAGCRHEACLFEKAALLNWAGLRNGSIEALEELDAYCLRIACLPEITRVAKRFREDLRLAETGGTDELD